ncbi:2-phospho-L-lactate guanylyltransferase (CobY/MobA/RfbA family) [Halorubrum alkaliphilum]|uniref:2-phospho-L-lactate guanylyltransferase (CobY/MobA/RfbA family) n=1 Tax=Halorubrum alkaliphilum TaxID=261290 RepID=A0A8T4GDD8_9EURY|nr:DUF2064 domain-containing protein [Halorubrum alkaliphilum]MBP1921501.1 2-phospho-L-lactate guanylyltransferase (CobY/MobA/RfbA family) [Halorubrum alkaliphilum]
MTVVAVLANPPREGLVATGLAESTPLSTAEAADLYEAAFRDIVLAVDRSGGELLVNYPDEESIPEAHRTDTPPEAALRALVADTLGGTEDARFERQVGSSFGARAGNTVTHLLREEGADSVAVVTPSTAMLSRTLIDSAAMKLRTNGVVIGPSTRGRVHYVGFTEPIDFEGAFEGLALPTLANRGRDAGLDVEFVESLPSLETREDLIDTIPLLRARFAAERIVPDYTAAFVHEHGLDVVDEDGKKRIVRD